MILKFFIPKEVNFHFNVYARKQNKINYMVKFHLKELSPTFLQNVIMKSYLTFNRSFFAVLNNHETISCQCFIKLVWNVTLNNIIVLQSLLI